MNLNTSKINPDFFKKIVSKPYIYPLIRGVLLQLLRPDRVAKVSIDFSMEILKKNFRKSSTVVMSNVFMPTEIFYALDIYPILPEVASGVSANFGIASSSLYEVEDVIYSKDLCSVHRSLVGLVKMGFLPKPNFLVVTNQPCHSAIHSFFLISRELGGDFNVIDVPYKYDELTLNYVSETLKKVFEKLSKSTGTRDSFNRLKTAIFYSNEARKYLVEINEMRKREVVIEGRKFLGYVGMIFSSFGSKYGVKFFRALRDEIRVRIKRREFLPVKKRIYWMHLGPYFKTDIFDWFNKKGAYIVFEETSKVYWDEFDINEPFVSLAKKVLSSTAFSNVDDRFSLAMEGINEYKAHGVVIFNQWGCRQGAGNSYILRKRLVDKGIPSIVIDGDLVDETNFPKEQIKTRLEGFLEVIL